MSSKYRLRFCKPGSNLSQFTIPEGSPATVRTLVGQGFLLPVICGLFTLCTSLLNRVSQVIHFCTKVDRVIHLVLDGWTFPDHSENVWEAR